MDKLRAVRTYRLANDYEIHSHQEVIDNDSNINSVSADLINAENDIITNYDNINSVSADLINVENDYVSLTQDQTITSNKVIDGNLTISSLSGAANTVPVTDANGTLIDTPVTITDAPLNGSMISIQPYPSDPVLKITHDVFLEDVDAITKRLVYFDGFDRYSVTLDKEV